MDFKKNWWKLLCIVLLSYVIIAGMLFQIPEQIPFLPKLKESVKNMFYHVPMWIVMQFSFFISVIYSLLYLKTNALKNDIWANEFIDVGLLFGGLGMITGMEWATIQWGAPWNNDPKQVGAGLTIIIYLAYNILRNSIKEENQKAKLAAVYNVFAFALLIPLLYIIPSHIKSLHPGSDNAPLESIKTQSQYLPYVFYPAMIGWFLLGLWIVNLKVRLRKLEHKKQYSTHV